MPSAQPTEMQEKSSLSLYHFYLRRREPLAQILQLGSANATGVCFQCFLIWRNLRR